MLNVLLGDECSEVPAAPLVGFHSAALFDVPIESAARDGSTMGDVQLKASRYYDLYAAFNFMDLTLEPEALGAGVSWKEIPSIENPLPLSEAESYLENAGQDFFSRGRLPINIAAIKQMRQSAIDMAVGAYLSGPITFLSQSFGVTSIFIESRKNLPRLKDLTERAAKVIESYASEMVSSGADAVMVLEPVAALLSPKLFNEIGMESISELIGNTRSKGVATVLHVCGNSNHILDLMTKTGPAAVSIDSQVSVDAPLKIDPNVTVLGNVGTTELQRLSPTDISRLSVETLNKTGGKRHVLSSACDVPVHATSENVKAMMRVAKDWHHS